MSIEGFKERRRTKRLDSDQARQLLDDSGALHFSIAAPLRRKHVPAPYRTDKDIGRAKPVAADFVGVTVPNRYVFGFGMDAYGLWRNLPSIYALKGT